MKTFKNPEMKIYSLSECDIVTLSGEPTLVDPVSTDPETPIIIVE